jgi:hypothetical protein
LSKNEGVGIRERKGQMPPHPTFVELHFHSAKTMGNMLLSNRRGDIKANCTSMLKWLYMPVPKIKYFTLSNAR